MRGQVGAKGRMPRRAAGTVECSAHLARLHGRRRKGAADGDTRTATLGPQDAAAAGARRGSRARRAVRPLRHSRAQPGPPGARRRRGSRSDHPRGLRLHLGEPGRLRPQARLPAVLDRRPHPEPGGAPAAAVREPRAVDRHRGRGQGPAGQHRGPRRLHRHLDARTAARRARTGLPRAPGLPRRRDRPRGERRRVAAPAAARPATAVHGNGSGRQPGDPPAGTGHRHPSVRRTRPGPQELP